MENISPKLTEEAKDLILEKFAGLDEQRPEGVVTEIIFLASHFGMPVEVQIAINRDRGDWVMLDDLAEANDLPELFESVADGELPEIKEID